MKKYRHMLEPRISDQVGEGFDEPIVLWCHICKAASMTVSTFDVIPCKTADGKPTVPVDIQITPEPAFPVTGDLWIKDQQILIWADMDNEVGWMDVVTGQFLEGQLAFSGQGVAQNLKAVRVSMPPLRPELIVAEESGRRVGWKEIMTVAERVEVVEEAMRNNQCLRVTDVTCVEPPDERRTVQGVELTALGMPLKDIYAGIHGMNQ